MTGLYIHRVASDIDNMRKLTLEIEPDERSRQELAPQFEKVYSYEVLETLKIDYEKGQYVDLIECLLKEGVSIDELDSIGEMEVLNVLGSHGAKHTCLVRGQHSLDPGNSYKELDLDLIWSKPSIISENRITVSCIGAQQSLLKFIDLVKNNVGKIANMTFRNAVYQNQNILSVLTEKQKDIILTAQKFGYYEYPRKINSEGLAKKVNISRATLVEHLRKAEGRIITEIAGGYVEP
jgi:hypothetical protein